MKANLKLTGKSIVESSQTMSNQLPTLSLG